MSNSPSSLNQLSDHDLLMEVRRLAGQERHATAQLIVSLAELDARRLYLGEGCSSLFTYCTQVLHLSEHAAYGRIEAARIARRFPVVLELLADGWITLTTVTLLGSHLTDENHRALLDAARRKSRRDIEQMIAQLRPQADVPSSTRKLPPPKTPVPIELQAGNEMQPAAAEPASAPVPPPTRPAVVAPLAPARYKVQFTVREDTYEKLRRAQDLLRHTVANGDPAAIFDRALTLLLADLEKTKLAVTTRPRAGRSIPANSRHIPAAVRRAVWKRDGGQCTFVGTTGRCSERGFLEFHHAVPYASGGQATVDNILLRCRSHNQYEAEQEFGACRKRTGRRARRRENQQPRLVRERRQPYVLENRGVTALNDVQLGSNRVAYTEAVSAGTSRMRPSAALASCPA